MRSRSLAGFFFFGFLLFRSVHDIPLLSCCFMFLCNVGLLSSRLLRRVLHLGMLFSAFMAFFAGDLDRRVPLHFDGFLRLDAIVP
jgi:hypothetical protein